MNPYLKENITNWISEFVESDESARFSSQMQSSGSFFLQELIFESLGDSADFEDVSEATLGEKIMMLSKKYDLAKEVLENFPDYAGTFFEDLEMKGRLSGGQARARFLRTFKGRLGHQTVRRPGSKINRNDPCPCGSGKKFKKCCFNAA